MIFSRQPNVLRLVAWGQSNTTGFGTTGFAIPARFVAADSRIWIYNHVTSTNQILQVGVNSNPRETIVDSTLARCWGGWAEFALRWLTDNPTGEVWIDHTAYGGRGVYTPDPAGREDFNVSTVGALSLYTDTITGINATTARLAQLHRTVVSSVIMSMSEGNRDAINGSAAAGSFGTNFAAVNTGIRTALGNSSAYVIYDKLDTDTGGGADATTVRNAQITYDATPNTIMLNADNYAQLGDAIHWTDAGQIAFGDDAYTAWKALN